MGLSDKLRLFNAIGYNLSQATSLHFIRIRVRAFRLPVEILKRIDDNYSRRALVAYTSDTFMQNTGAVSCIKQTELRHGISSMSRSLAIKKGRENQRQRTSKKIFKKMKFRESFMHVTFMSFV